MSTYDESKHARATDGKWAPKRNDAPKGALSHGAALNDKPLSVKILPVPDPDGGYDTLVEAPTGRHYLREGVQHREDGPAYIGRDGSERWFQNGQLHRDPTDGPALLEDGYSEFYEGGVLVRAS